MQYLTPNSVSGDVISLAKNHPRHMSGTAGRTVMPLSEKQKSKETSFGNLLSQALSTVNSYQQRSLTMNEKLVTDPNEVNMHDVTIALAEANLTLSMTKAIAERVISAYREIISIR